MVAKKFQRKLPRQYAFIFEDPKNANEFYDFINMKYNLNDYIVEHNVPFKIKNSEFFLSFHETERVTKTVNLVPVLVDAKRESNGNEAILTDLHTSRKGKWYIVLTVTDSDINDSLAPNYIAQKEVIEYLRALKTEYLTTHNYVEVLLKK